MGSEWQRHLSVMVDRRRRLRGVRMGGYPRLWWRSSGHLDLSEPVADADVPTFEVKWRAHHVRVEWLRSPHGRIDAVLPQTLERIVHNANVRSWREHGAGY